MKDITAILVHYSDQSALFKAIHSLHNIRSRLQSLIIFQSQETPTINGHGWKNQIDYVLHEQTLNETIKTLTTKYVLFLHDTDYLSPSVPAHSLQLPNPKTVFATTYHNRNTTIHRPLFASTSFLKEKPFLSNHQIPFKEALFPTWLLNVEASLLLIKNGYVKQSRKTNSANRVEKEHFLQKYQLKSINNKHPSISVLISNYNMEKYVETAIVSCLLQNEQFDQILIIDDGSTDNSYRQIKHWDNGKQIQVFHKKNEGKAKALNQLLPHVTSEFILELDADDWLDPDAASIMKQHVSTLPNNFSVLYGNLRKWKQQFDDVLFKGISNGVKVNGIHDLLSYRFPLGPRIYRTNMVKKEGGFPVIDFDNGRMYEDVSMLLQLKKKYPFRYHDFTVYNVREHMESITKKSNTKWEDYLESLHLN